MKVIVNADYIHSRKAGRCLTFLLHSTECSTETRRKDKERERESKQSLF